MKPRIVILSTADFDSPVWTNKQHLAVGLATKFEVVYVESLGLRQPSISLADLVRMVRKILQLLKRRPKAYGNNNGGHPESLTIVTPFVIPFHKYSAVRFLNAQLLRHQMKKVVVDAENSTLWTFSPLTYGLERAFGNVIYHSVDLLHALPRVPGSVLQKFERELIGSADHIIASSRGVEKYLRGTGAQQVLLWENVAHVEMFSAATGQSRRNRAVFAGNLTPSKINIGCLQSILDLGIELAIAGPADIDGAGSSPEISGLLNHPNVTYCGNLPLEELADLLATSKVGLIPYEINKYTEGVFPMKVYEYLAAGLSVVSTPLPSLEDHHIVGLDLVEADEFGSHTKRLMAEHNVSRIAENIDMAQTHSWTERIEQAATIVKSDGTNG